MIFVFINEHDCMEEGFFSLLNWCTFSLGHYVVCSSSEYPFGIFKLFSINKTAISNNPI
jgi:hypothetical protein